MKNTHWILGAFAVIALAGCQSVPPADTGNNKAGIANPASTNCTEKGGTLEIKTNKKGEYGVCVFAGDKKCEEWAMLRGQCPEGGVDISGVTGEAEIFCVITGGTVESIEGTAMCKRIDGTLCNAQANLDGDCPDPNDPNPNAGNTEAP